MIPTECFMSGDPYKGDERTAGVRATQRYYSAWTGTVHMKCWHFGSVHLVYVVFVCVLQMTFWTSIKKIIGIIGPLSKEGKYLGTKKTQVKPNANRSCPIGLTIHIQPQLTRLSLQCRHNERDDVSNHLHLNWLLNRLFRRSSKKTSKLRATGLCGGNSPVTGEFPTQWASNAENVSIGWRHHGVGNFVGPPPQQTQVGAPLTGDFNAMLSVKSKSHPLYTWIYLRTF